MRLRVGGLVLVMAVIASVASGWIDDNFPGASLGSDWDWNHMGTCQGSVNNGLILNPSQGTAGWRQSAIVTEQPSYSWVTVGGAVSYRFTVDSWNLTSNNNVAARMYLSTTDGKVTPDPWDDYNNSNGVMAELSLNSGHFWFNLFEKSALPGTSYNNETYKLAFLDVGTAVNGYTFGMDLSNNTAKLWYNTGASLVSSSVTTLATARFNQDTRGYVGVINGTGSDLGPTETVEFSNVTIIPEPGVGVLLLGGLYFLRRRFIG